MFLKNSFIYLFILGVCLSLCKCSTKHFLKSGIIRIDNYFINIDSTKPMPLPVQYRTMRIWFKDSCIIVERKLINETENNEVVDSIVKRVYRVSYDVMGYTYVNLQTKSGQNYFNFSDTALPVGNFILEDKELDFVVNFNRKKDLDIKGELTQLPDTIENNILYKRILVTRNTGSDTAECLNCLDCQSPKTIFHLNSTLDEMYPGCRVVKGIFWAHQAYVYSGIPLKWVTEFRIIQKKLSSNENKIFKQWRKNAALSSLPIISYDSANRVLTKENMRILMMRENRRSDSVIKFIKEQNRKKFLE